MNFTLVAKPEPMNTLLFTGTRVSPFYEDGPFVHHRLKPTIHSLHRMSWARSPLHPCLIVSQQRFGNPELEAIAAAGPAGVNALCRAPDQSSVGSSAVIFARNLFRALLKFAGNSYGVDLSVIGIGAIAMTITTYVGRALTWSR